MRFETRRKTRSIIAIAGTAVTTLASISVSQAQVTGAGTYTDNNNTVASTPSGGETLATYARSATLVASNVTAGTYTATTYTSRSGGSTTVPIVATYSYDATSGLVFTGGTAQVLFATFSGLSTYSNYAAYFTLAGSNNGTSFTSIPLAMTTDTSVSTPGYNPEIFTFAATSYRYLQFTIDPTQATTTNPTSNISYLIQPNYETLTVVSSAAAPEPSSVGFMSVFALSFLVTTSRRIRQSRRV